MTKPPLKAETNADGSTRYVPEGTPSVGPQQDKDKPPVEKKEKAKEVENFTFTDV